MGGRRQMNGEGRLTSDFADFSDWGGFEKALGEKEWAVLCVGDGVPAGRRSDRPLPFEMWGRLDWWWEMLLNVSVMRRMTILMAAVAMAGWAVAEEEKVEHLLYPFEVTLGGQKAVMQEGNMLFTVGEKGQVKMPDIGKIFSFLKGKDK